MSYEICNKLRLRKALWYFIVKDSRLKGYFDTGFLKANEQNQMSCVKRLKVIAIKQTYYCCINRMAEAVYFLLSFCLSAKYIGH